MPLQKVKQIKRRRGAKKYNPLVNLRAAMSGSTQRTVPESVYIAANSFLASLPDVMTTSDLRVQLQRLFNEYTRIQGYSYGVMTLFSDAFGLTRNQLYEFMRGKYEVSFTVLESLGLDVIPILVRKDRHVTNLQLTKTASNARLGDLKHKKQRSDS